MAARALLPVAVWVLRLCGAAADDAPDSAASFCCMWPDLGSTSSADICGICEKKETSSEWCGQSRERCGGCGKVWCGPDVEALSGGAAEASARAENATTTSTKAGESSPEAHRKKGSKGKAHHQKASEASTTATAGPPETSESSTTSSAGSTSPPTPRPSSSTSTAESTSSSSAASTTTVQKSTTHVKTTVASKPNKTAKSTTFAGAESRKMLVHSSNRSSNQSSVKSTAKAPKTTTATPTTTRTKRRFPFSSMMCWAVIMTSGYELDLFRPQCENRVSIWRCDEHIAFSDFTVDLCNGENTVAIGDMTSPISDWGSWSNSGNFLRAWGMVISDGRFRDHEWTVKVDADSVFYPERLRRQLAQFSTEKPVFLHNWRDNFGFLGPIEVLSTLAVESLGEGNSTCTEAIGVDNTGEDGWLDSCLRFLNVSYADAFDILDFSGNIDMCGNGNIATFHPYKSWDKYNECMSRGPPMENPPPIEGAEGESFCCSGAQDEGDMCNTCWPSSKVGNSEYCGASRENCESCSNTWCEAGADEKEWLLDEFDVTPLSSGAARATRSGIGSRRAVFRDAREPAAALVAAALVALLSLFASAFAVALRRRRGAVQQESLEGAALVSAVGVEAEA